ncbi:MAG TPA: hypothetical protein VNZ04_11690, partial [Trinickia sp.]|nr:hypothetical protein [Trinickia sp.]
MNGARSPKTRELQISRGVATDVPISKAVRPRRNRRKQAMLKTASPVASRGHRAFNASSNRTRFR